jgi:hypothetical protein
MCCGVLRFADILCYTGELYHAFPITCGMAVLNLLRKEPLFADEVYAQVSSVCCFLVDIVFLCCAVSCVCSHSISLLFVFS